MRIMNYYGAQELAGSFRTVRKNTAIIADEIGEERWYALGATDRFRILFPVSTYRGERMRPITGWDADKKLRELYFRKKGE